MIKKIFIIFLLICNFSVFGQVQMPSATDIAGEHFLRRSERIIKRALEEGDTTNTQPIEYNLDAAQRIANDAKPVPQQPMVINNNNYQLPPIGSHMPSTPRSVELSNLASKEGSYIFISLSMTDQELLDAMQVANQYGSNIYFRGVLKGQSLEKAYMHFHQLAKKLDPYPAIGIDPRPFQEFDIKVVPTVVVTDGLDYVKVSGTLSVSYAKDRLHSKMYGDAGSRGDTKDIVEVDLIDEIGDRLAKIDFEAKKKAALARFWSNMQFTELPNSTKNQIRYFDPSVRNEDAIEDINGNLIVPAGAVYNPLDMVKFSKTVYIFNATDKRQSDFIAKLAKKENDAGRGVSLMTTNLNTDKGWEGFKELNEKFFPNRVFVLNKMIVDRFGIVSVPSVISGDGRRLKIQQFDHNDLE